MAHAVDRKGRVFGDAGLLFQPRWIRLCARIHEVEAARIKVRGFRASKGACLLQTEQGLRSRTFQSPNPVPARVP